MCAYFEADTASRACFQIELKAHLRIFCHYRGSRIVPQTYVSVQPGGPRKMLFNALGLGFLVDGHFGHHVRQMRQIYAERMEVLCDAANQRLGGMPASAESCLGNSSKSVAGYCPPR